ncbi:MAG: arylsulfatase [Melioribacteraceae bacterium]|nr:arylsulfatase [Melioribacteraceae bacterium]
MMIKKNLILLIFIIAVVTNFSCKDSVERNEQQRPNIIYVLADDLGYGDITTFNPESKIKTPHLDNLAAEGMIFKDAHTSSSVCTPTRYGILTGRYNWRTKLKRGVLNGRSPALISEARETVASLLKKSGYSTAYIGKWHLGWNWAKKENNSIDFSKPVQKTPNSNGFDYAYGHCGSLDMPPYVYVENGMPTAIPVNTTENKDEHGFWRNGLTSPDFVHEEVTPHFFEKSFQYIKEQAKTENPFFLYLPLPSPHTPILPTEKWQGKSGLNPYGDFVMEVDHYMGKLAKVIKEAGIEENTLVFFTSDNGCSPRADFNELISKGHNPSSIFRGHKADIFEGGHRVPFIVKWPAGIKPGVISNKTICTTDLMATCASLTNQKLADNSGEDSFDMTPLFRNHESDEFQREATVHHSSNGSFAIRKGDWKLILCRGSGGWSAPKPAEAKKKGLPKVQLYDLSQDIGEQINLQAQYPAIVEELTALLQRYADNGRSTPGKPQQNNGDVDIYYGLNRIK